MKESKNPFVSMYKGFKNIFKGKKTIFMKINVVFLMKMRKEQ